MNRPIPPRRPVFEPVETRPRLLRPNRKARIAGVVAAALVISWGAPAANAYWQTLSSNNGGARADAILAVAAPTASPSAGAASVSWAQSTTAAGRPVSGYTVARYSSPTGGTKVAAGGGCGGTIATLTCSEAALPAGTWYYTVTPVLASWTGVESARSAGVTAADTTQPDAPTISAPAIVNSANVTSVPVSGTAEAGSSVTVSGTDAGAAHTSSQTLTANSSGQWTAADFNLTSFNNGTITYTALATDAAGNVSDPGTATSTKDTVAPAVVSVSLSNGGTQFTPDAGDKAVLTFSEPLLPPTICGNWTNTSGSQTANGTVTIAAGNALSFAATDPGCPSVRFGSVALSSSYSAGGALTFNSSLTWNSGTRQLTVTLVSLTGGIPVSKTGNVTPTYTSPSGLTDGVGNPLPTTPFAGSNSRF
ncbi:hypothetical protein [Arthrobacter sp. Soil762]|uniref:hypothetical protein n=1 Tax=Arthrobacter sp. Soil762 TaxID=1736401 RepID=UPI000701E5B2|nr:hypothetical protein [Arthrobacter sp. Soil762]KRE72092.1 hypothetical protein ASG77_09305 [Arthrobacter sp. Soil762]